MSSIVTVMAQLPSFRMRAPACLEQIDAAEKALGLQFSEEYREYLSAFGAASIYGHEFTGICAAKRLDVVVVTMYERERNRQIANDYYVLEQLNIDDVVIWQAQNGNIYRTIGDSEPMKICDSFCNYINR